jgi:hypothetical protein
LPVFSGSFFPSFIMSLALPFLRQLLFQHVGHTFPNVADEILLRFFLPNTWAFDCRCNNCLGDKFLVRSFWSSLGCILSHFTSCSHWNVTVLSSIILRSGCSCRLHQRWVVIPSITASSTRSQPVGGGLSPQELGFESGRPCAPPWAIPVLSFILLCSWVVA